MNQPQTLYKNSGKNKHTGFTLLEVLIASMLGLIIIGGIFVVYQGTRQSFIEREQLSLLDNIGRNALYELTQGIEHTGYQDQVDAPIAEYFVHQAVVPSACVDQGINDTGTNVADSNVIAFSTDNHFLDNDAIGITYLGSDTLKQDCAGITLPNDCQVGVVSIIESAKIYNSYSIGLDENNVPELQCGGSLSTAKISLIQGVEKMQVLYGVDKDRNGLVDNFMNATQVSLANAWNAIISVQVALLVRSPRPYLQTPVAKSYVLLDQKIDMAADRYLRAVYAKTIRIPNINLIQ